MLWSRWSECSASLLPPWLGSAHSGNLAFAKPTHWSALLQVYPSSFIMNLFCSPSPNSCPFFGGDAAKNMVLSFPHKNFWLKRVITLKRSNYSNFGVGYWSRKGFEEIICFLRSCCHLARGYSSARSWCRPCADRSYWREPRGAGANFIDTKNALSLHNRPLTSREKTRAIWNNFNMYKCLSSPPLHGGRGKRGGESGANYERSSPLVYLPLGGFCVGFNQIRWK